MATTRIKRTFLAFTALASGGRRDLWLLQYFWRAKRVLLRYRDFLLKPELLRAISDLGFEHPSEGTRLLNLSQNSGAAALNAKERR